MSDSVRPCRRQPTRLLCPWDSPGKNTGVGCHCLLQCMRVKNQSEVAQLGPTQLCPTPVWFSDSQNVSIHSCHLLFDYFQFAWFMNRTFLVPMQYCSLQLWTLLPSPVTSTPGCCFCFGSISSFFLELFLYSSPVAHWAPTNMGGRLSVSYLFAFSYCSCSKSQTHPRCTESKSAF